MAQSSKHSVSFIARLAALPLSDEEVKKLPQAFEKTIEVVDQLQSMDLTGIEPTSQVTGLENIFREDIVDETRMFTQQEAFSNAPRTNNGYFLVDAVLDLSGE